MWKDALELRASGKALTEALATGIAYKFPQRNLLASTFGSRYKMYFSAGRSVSPATMFLAFVGSPGPV
jgi:hypothetical protein